MNNDSSNRNVALTAFPWICVLGAAVEVSVFGYYAARSVLGGRKAR